MSSPYHKTLSLCSQLLATFKPELLGVEDHLDNFLKSDSCIGIEESEQTFLFEVFSGCVQYQSLINVVVNGYYASDEGNCSLMVDSPLYCVVCYLLMFRLEELGMTSFKKLVNSQHSVKMHKFLSFFLRKDNLHGWITDRWLKTYERNFVQLKILNPLHKFEQELNDYLQYLEAKTNNKLTTTCAVKPVTKTKPFDITMPKPRSIPTPEKIPVVQPHKPVPKTTYVPPTELKAISQLRDTQKLRAKDKLEESNMKQFSCANTDKSIKTKNVIKQIIEERESKLDFPPIKPQPIPISMKESQPLKLNTTAILREGARIQRNEQEEEKRLASLEAGQKDDSEFLKWQEEMKQKQIAEELSERKKRYLEGQLSYEEAIIAKQNSIQVTRNKVSQMKEESEELMKEYFQRREDERKEMRKLVESTMQGHQNTKEAKVKLQKMKQKIVQQIEKEKQEMFRKALEEEELEMRRKIELIQLIKAMESIPVIRTKHIDLTETGGQGLLAEMSIAELRERLALMKIIESEEQEKKRKEIAAVKESKEQLLNETINAIAKHKMVHSAKLKTDQEKQKQSLQKHIASSERELNDLQRKLEVKKKERERLKQMTTEVVSTQQKNTQTINISESPLDTLLRTATK